jgi:hypothetical protein
MVLLKKLGTVNAKVEGWIVIQQGRYLGAGAA